MGAVEELLAEVAGRLYSRGENQAADLRRILRRYGSDQHVGAARGAPLSGHQMG